MALFSLFLSSCKKRKQRQCAPVHKRMARVVAWTLQHTDLSLASFLLSPVKKRRFFLLQDKRRSFIRAWGGEEKEKKSDGRGTAAHLFSRPSEGHFGRPLEISLEAEHGYTFPMELQHPKWPAYRTPDESFIRFGEVSSAFLTEERFFIYALQLVSNKLSSY